MVLIENTVALIAAAIFGVCAAFFSYKLSKSEGYGDFTVGLSYLDFYTLIIALVPMTAAVSYFLMALGFGTISINGVEIVWLRYFEWAISTPMLVVGIVLLSLDRKLTIDAMFLDILMILTGLLATINPSPLREVSFIVSTLAFIGLAHILWNKSTAKVNKRPAPIRSLFKRLRNFTLAIWFVYPALWIVSTEGLGVISGELSFIAFTTMDLVSKIGYAAIVMKEVSAVNEA